MNPSKKLKFWISAMVALTCATSVQLFSQTVTTVPVGAVTVTIAAGTGTARVLTPISLPLLTTKVASGQMLGAITSVSANTITAANAGWSAGGLSLVSAPTLIQITSGSAIGRTFLVSTSTANTTTTITLDTEDASRVDLTTLGIVTGDTYKLLECDTLGSVFTNIGVQGGTAVTTSDIVQVLVGGSLAQYYFNTSSNAWLKVALGSPNSDNLPIRPDAIILYNRIAATPLSLVLMGDVPSVKRVSLMGNSGLTVMSTLWPVDMQLSTMGIQTSNGWVSSTDSSVADVVSVFVAGSWSQYFYNGTAWRKIALGNPISDNLVISAGTGVLINKRGSASGVVTVSQDIPYSL